MVRQPALRVLPDSELSEAETPSKLKICQVIATAEGGRWMVEQLRDLRDDYGCEVMAVVGGERGGLVDMLRAERIPCHVEKFYFRSVQIFYYRLQSSGWPDSFVVNVLTLSSRISSSQSSLLVLPRGWPMCRCAWPCMRHRSIWKPQLRSGLIA